jgi:hypothetical protein
MSKLLTSLHGLSSRTLLLLLALTLTASCSGNPLSLLTGGGTNVAANTQVGKENNQGVNTTVTRDTSVRPVLRPEGPVETLTQDNSTTNNTEIDPFLLILLIAGWLAPSPQEIGRGLMNLLNRRRRY